MIWTYFIVFMVCNTNGSDASSNNLQGLHHKTNISYENLQMLNDNITIVIWKDTNVNGIVIIASILLFESRKITSNFEHDSY